jgi:hypothetical protein
MAINLVSFYWACIKAAARESGKPAERWAVLFGGPIISVGTWLGGLHVSFSGELMGAAAQFVASVGIVSHEVV